MYAYVFVRMFPLPPSLCLSLSLPPLLLFLTHLHTVIHTVREAYIYKRLHTTQLKAFLGEVGAGNNAVCESAVEDMLAYMETNSTSRQLFLSFFIYLYASISIAIYYNYSVF